MVFLGIQIERRYIDSIDNLRRELPNIPSRSEIVRRALDEYFVNIRNAREK